MVRGWPAGPGMSAELDGTSEAKGKRCPEMGLAILLLMDILGVAPCIIKLGGGQAIR